MSSTYENSIPIVAFAGAMRAGKSTSAKTLSTQFGYRTYSFADPIRKLCRAMGITKKYYGGNKDLIIPHLGKSARYIMQTIGTEWGRELVKQSIWLDMMRLRLESASKDKNLICIDDVRFDNEATLVRECGGIVVRVVRGDTQSDHISEAGVSDDLISLEIENTGSVTNLSEKLEKIIYDKSLLPRQSR
jgi:hypothetical protein